MESRPEYLQHISLGIGQEGERISCGFLKKKAGDDTVRKATYSLVLILEGRGLFSVNEKELILEKGHVFQRIPGADYQFKVLSDYKEFYLECGPAMYNMLRASALIDEDDLAFSIGFNADLLEWAESFLKRTEQHGLEKQWLLYTELFEFMVHIHQRKSEASFNELELYKNLWLEECEGKRSFVEFCSDMDINPEILRKRMTAYYKESPGRMKNERRLLLAQKLLKENTAIQEVSERCGYSNRYAFTLAFKKRFGRSPGMVREK